MDNTGRGYRAKNGTNNELNGVGIGLSSGTLLIIKLPYSCVLRIMSRSLFLTMFLLALPSIFCIMRDSSSKALYKSNDDLDINCFEILPILLHDLLDEGLIKKGNKGLSIGAREGDIEDDSEILNDSGVDLSIELDLNQKKLSQNDVFDFVLASSFKGIKLIDRVLTTGGIVIAPLSKDPANMLQEQSNYRIVYLRRFENTMVALRKIEASNGMLELPTKEILRGIASNVKKSTLKSLEDVYLEPPRRTKLSFGSRKLKFLPDMLRDSLDNYPRRVFISDETNALDWFYNNYPTRDQIFEIYNMEIEINKRSFISRNGIFGMVNEECEKGGLCCNEGRRTSSRGNGER